MKVLTLISMDRTPPAMFYIGLWSEMKRRNLNKDETWVQTHHSSSKSHQWDSLHFSHSQPNVLGTTAEIRRNNVMFILWGFSLSRNERTCRTWQNRGIDEVDGFPSCGKFINGRERPESSHPWSLFDCPPPQSLSTNVCFTESSSFNVQLGRVIIVRCMWVSKCNIFTMFCIPLFLRSSLVAGC